MSRPSACTFPFALCQTESSRTAYTLMDRKRTEVGCLVLVIYLVIALLSLSITVGTIVLIAWLIKLVVL